MSSPVAVSRLVFIAETFTDGGLGQIIVHLSVKRTSLTALSTILFETGSFQKPAFRTLSRLVNIRTRARISSSPTHARIRRVPVGTRNMPHS